MQRTHTHTKQASVLKKVIMGWVGGDAEKEASLLEHRKNMGDVMQKSKVLQGTKYLGRKTKYLLMGEGRDKL